MLSSHLAIVTGTLLAGLAVILGAFGAHAIAADLPRWYPDPAVAERMRETWEVAVRYQMYHALGCLLLGIWAEKRTGRAVTLPLSLFIFGVIIFCGLLYALVLTGYRPLGAIVPLGGLTLIMGWGFWGVSAIRETRQSNF